MKQPATETKALETGTRRPLVLYDGGCPMCSREIAHYRRLQGADAVEWLDIAATDAPDRIDGISRSTAMARFHVRAPDGRWHTGAFGFVELWGHLPGYRWLARLVRATRLTGLLDLAYTRFARWRLARQHGKTDCERCVVAAPGRGDDGTGARRPRPGTENTRQTADDAAG